VRTKLRHLLTDAVLEKSFKTSEKFEEPDVVLTPASFLYSDGDGFHFMDEESYEQFSLSQEQLGDERLYLKENMSLQVRKYNGDPVSLALPATVDLAVTDTEPGVRGDSASGGTTKSATLETGLQVRVPLFIKEGEIVRVNTQTGEFLSRAKE
jgi:elongation factor P